MSNWLSRPVAAVPSAPVPTGPRASWVARCAPGLKRALGVAGTDASAGIEVAAGPHPAA